MSKLISKALLEQYQATKEPDPDFAWDQVWRYIHDVLTMKETSMVKNLAGGNVQVSIHHIASSFIVFSVWHNQDDLPEPHSREGFENCRMVRTSVEFDESKYAVWTHGAHYNAMLFAEGEDPYERDEHAVD